MTETWMGVDLPKHMARLPKDSAGRPVPKFVAWIDGKPDFRVMDPEHLVRCVKLGVCWTCGEPLGSHKTFVIGPMCAVNRVSAEPPSHYDCASYSAQACPFLSNPHKVRREANKPAHDEPPGVMIARNPGVTLLWTTRKYRPWRVPPGGHGGSGILFDIGTPEQVDWIREGRPATRAEVMESIESGLPQLQALADEEGHGAQADLAKKYDAALALVPA